MTNRAVAPYKRDKEDGGTGCAKSMARDGTSGCGASQLAACGGTTSSKTAKHGLANTNGAARARAAKHRKATPSLDATWVVAVIGYNNTRIGDVRKIRSLASNRGAKLLLVKKHPTADDMAAADFVADIDLDDHLNGASACQAAADEQGLRVIAVLPFSDRGVVVGTQWAALLGLPGGDPNTVHVGLDKHAFRLAEAECRDLRPWYYRPFCGEIATLQDILSSLRRATRFGMGVFVKPKKEGNSRGGTHVTSEASAAMAHEAVRPYLSEGALAEEYLCGVHFPFGREFSYDRVGSMFWVTAKETTTGLYRAEVQQIVPAPLPKADYDRLCEAGEAVADFSGSAVGGACHIEVMLLAPEETTPSDRGGGHEHKVATIEPNLRPAGMHIWDLTEVAFGRSPWEEWLAWATGQPTRHAPLQRQAYAGIRMIPVARDGIFGGVPEECVRRIRTDFPAVIDINVTYPVGKRIRAKARDNSEFIGQVLAKHPDAAVLQTTLLQVCNILSQHAKVQE